jgi:hypothetical protein
MKPAMENSLSHGTVVAGVARYFFASDPTVNLKINRIKN